MTCGSGEPFTPTGDLIEDILRRFKQLTCDVKAAAIAEQVAREARLAYEKDNPYIATLKSHERKAAIARIDPGRPYADQAKELGLSKSLVWKRINRKGKYK